MIAGITAVVKVLNDFLSAENGVGSRPSSEAVMTNLSDAVSLLTDSCHELDVRRREGFKQDLKEEYRALCSTTAPVTSLLFGEELSEAVKSLSDTIKVTKQIVGTSAVTKQPRNFQHRQPMRRLPFLGSGPRGRGHPGYNRRHPQQQQQHHQQKSYNKPHAKWTGMRNPPVNHRQ